MYNNDSDSLNAGAPDIRLSGNQQMASYGFDEAMAESRQAYDDARKRGVIPIDMEFEDFLDLMREGGFLEGRAPQQNSGIMASAPTGTYTQNRKQMMAGGGIAGLEKRQGYFLGGVGDFFGGIKDKIVDDLIPNEIKENPVLTAALVGGGINQFGIPFTEGMGQNWLGDLLGRDLVLGDTGMFEGGSDKPDLINFGNLFGTKVTPDTQINKQIKDLTGGGIFGEDQEDDVARMMQSMGLNTPEKLYRAVTTPGFKLTDPSTWMGGITNALSSAASPYLGEGEGRRVNPLYPLGIGAAVGKYVSGLPKDELPMDTTSIDPAAIATAARGTDAEGAAAGLRFLPEQVTRAAQGGRIGYADAGDVEIPKVDTDNILKKLLEFRKKREGYEDAIFRSERIDAAEGGLMNLGGMEKDYRQEGGFVPIGGKEKADDVPARLSKNEFVFTADAVRAAGGGDIDEGAAVMERLMENLEAGGKVSEDSQGLEGARGMFANAQKLQNRII